MSEANTEKEPNSGGEASFRPASGSPKTDALSFDSDEYGYDVVSADFARKLETENNRFREALEDIALSGSGALNNAFPEEAPDVVAHLTAIAERVLENSN